MGGYVSEIFGFPPTNKKKEAKYFRKNYFCPFMGENVLCDPHQKKTNLQDEDGNLLLKHQTGACSAFHKYADSPKSLPIIICPYRFFEKDSNGDRKAFRYISDKFFNGNDLLFVDEVGLGKYGRADLIICEFDKKKPTKIFNINHGEIQADCTTGTRELVYCIKDFFNGIDITQKKYNYGLNTKSSIKTSSLQMIDKGFLFKKLGKKSFWILQDTLFDRLCEVYNIEMLDITNEKCPDDHTLIFIVCELVREGARDILNLNPEEEDIFKLEINRTYSCSVDALQKGISEKGVIKESRILNATLNKIKENCYYRINDSK